MYLRHSTFPIPSRIVVIILLHVFLFHLPIPASAHKLRIFAWINAGKVYVESGLYGSRNLINSNVTVKNSLTGKIITQGISDSQGLFSFALPQNFQENPADLTITVATDDGHRAEWVLTQNDFQVSFQSEKLTSNKLSDSADPTTLDREISSLVLENMQEMIDERLEKELAPIYRQLAYLNEEKISLRDIIGGIGYLVGLAGFAAWLKSRGLIKSKHDDNPSGFDNNA